MFKTILVPHDFSECANRAEELAASWAEQGKTRIVLFHACQLPAGLSLGATVTPEGGAPVTIEHHVLGGALDRLEARAAPLRKRGISVSVRAAIGEIAVATVEEATACRADIIVMGTHGRTGLAHFILGSSAEKIIRTARVPVVTLRHGAEEGIVDTPEELDARDEQAG